MTRRTTASAASTSSRRRPRPRAPTSLVIDYQDQDVAGLDESTFAIYAWNTDTQRLITSADTVDTAANTVTTTVTKFRLYTIGAAMPARAVMLVASGGDLIGDQASARRRFTVTASGFVQNNGAAVPNGTMAGMGQRGG